MSSYGRGGIEMKIYSIGKILHITELDEKICAAVSVSLPTIADGAAIVITRESDKKYVSAVVKGGKCIFPGDFFSSSDYTLQTRNSAGEIMRTTFTVRDGQMLSRQGAALEREELWAAVIYLAEQLNKDEKKIDRVVDGYATE